MSKQNFTRPCLDLNKRPGAREERTLPLRCFITFVRAYYLMVRVKTCKVFKIIILKSPLVCCL